MASNPKTREAIIRQKRLRAVPIRSLSDLENAIASFPKRTDHYAELTMELGKYWVTVYIGSVVPRVKLCKWCNKAFSPLFSHQLYCSEACKYKVRDRSSAQSKKIKRLKKISDKTSEKKETQSEAQNGAST